VGLVCGRFVLWLFVWPSALGTLPGSLRWPVGSVSPSPCLRPSAVLWSRRVWPAVFLGRVGALSPSLHLLLRTSRLAHMLCFVRASVSTGLPFCLAPREGVSHSALLI